MHVWRLYGLHVVGSWKIKSPQLIRLRCNAQVLQIHRTEYGSCTVSRTYDLFNVCWDFIIFTYIYLYIFLK